MLILNLIVCSLVLASGHAYKTSPGIHLNITKTLVVLDFTEGVTIVCSTNDKIAEDGFKVINKIEIDKTYQDSTTLEMNHEIVASIDSLNGTRGAIFKDGTLAVNGSIIEVTNSYLMMTFTVATNFALGTYSCHVHGYSNEVSAQPLIRSSINSQNITKTETDIDTVTQLVVDEKKAIAELDQDLRQLQSNSLMLMLKVWSLLDTDNLYGEYWPTGNFSLLSPATGCPPNTRAGGWRRPSIKIFTKNWAGNADRIPESFPAQPSQDKDASITLYFCSLVGKGHYQWPAGDYCIHKNRPENNCSAGFDEGAIAMGISSMSLNKDVLKFRPPASVSTLDDDNTLINMSFCCRNDGNVTNAISLPTQAPFYLYQHKSKSCQAVKDMDVKSDYIHIDTTGQNVDEDAGETPRHRLNGVRLWLCLYTPRASPLEEIQKILDKKVDKDKVEGGANEGVAAEGGDVEGATAEGGAAEGSAAVGGAGEGSAAEEGAAEGGAAQGGAAQGEAAEGGISKGGAADGEAAEGGAVEGGAVEGGATASEAADGGAPEGDAAKGEVAKGGAVKGRAPEGGVAKGGAFKKRAVKGRTFMQRNAARGGAAKGGKDKA